MAFATLERLQSPMYQADTEDIRIIVRPAFLEEQSSPADDRYVWAYHIRIENHGRITVRLRDRYWRITDARGRVQEVAGPGVVGEQPVLAPGQSYEYTSGTPLATASGIMSGHYGMEREDGTAFNAVVPAFSLDSPHEPRRMN